MAQTANVRPCAVFVDHLLPVRKPVHCIEGDRVGHAVDDRCRAERRPKRMGTAGYRVQVEIDVDTLQRIVGGIRQAKPLCIDDDDVLGVLVGQAPNPPPPPWL